MKTGIAILMTAVLLSACSYKEYNAQVERMNHDRMVAMGEAMAKQKDEGGRIALAILFATNAGQQSLAKPESARDYIGPINALIAPWIPLIWHGGDDTTSQAITAGRDVYMSSTRADTHYVGGSELQINGDSNKQYVCPTCEQGTTEEGDDPGEAGCSSNLPAGWRGSTPLYSPNCSCTSHYAGRC